MNALVSHILAISCGIVAFIMMSLWFETRETLWFIWGVVNIEGAVWVVLVACTATP